MARVEVPIVMAADSSYIPYAAVSICSMIATKSPDTLYRVHILHTEPQLFGMEHLLSLSQTDVSIELHNTYDSISPYENQLYSKSHYTKEMYLRWWIGDLFPNYDKVIYLDCDTIVCCDLLQLYQEDISDASVGGVIDFATPSVCRRIENQLGLQAEQYINTGVLLMNSATWRRKKIAQHCVSCLNQHEPLVCPDQDVLNLVCQNSIKYLDVRWNAQWHHFWDRPDNHLIPPFDRMFDLAIHNPGILHFTSSIKPWNHPSAPCANQFWHYAAQLPAFFPCSQ